MGREHQAVFGAVLGHPELGVGSAAELARVGAHQHIAAPVPAAPGANGIQGSLIQLVDDFHDLPPTLLAFGEHDFLAFEDIAYARHAVKAGVRIKTIVYRGLGHGFADQIGVMPQGEDLMGEIAAMMREVL